MSALGTAWHAARKVLLCNMLALVRFQRHGTTLSRPRELPYCGHGVLAAGGAVLRSGDGACELACSVGPVTVRREGERVYALTRTPPWIRPEGKTVCAEVLAALGIAPEQVMPNGIHVASMGSPKWIVPVASRVALYAIRPNGDALASASRKHGVNGAYVYCPDTEY
jgi:trans-2,3-dihydro-3-hydroxyanthranilate isomerase